MTSGKQMFGGLPRVALSLFATVLVALGLAFGLGQSEALAEVPPHSHEGWAEWTDALAVQQYGNDSAKADNCLPQVSGSYYLTKNVSLPEYQDGLPVTWEVPNGTTISLCLNGNSITGCNVNWNTATVRGTLNLYDEDDEGILTHTEAPNAWGILVEGLGSTLNMYGGSIKENSYGVYVASGTLNMYGGNIEDNHSTDYANGSGVVVAGNGTFNMFDGEIANNSAALDGGGVYVTDGNFAMAGGAVTNNAATRTGGGVYVKNGTFTVSGNVSITNNTAADNVASNAYLGQDKTITVADALGTNARIGVSMKSPDTFTTGFKDTMGGADPATYFTSDDDKYAVTRDADGEGMLAVGYPVTVAEGIEGGTVEVDRAKAAEGDLVKITARADDGYELDTVTVTDVDGKQVETKDGSFAMPASDVTVSAKFVKKLEQVKTPTFDPAEGAYTSGQSVTIGCATEGATVRYTTDGTEPTKDSAAYDGPIAVSTSTTIKAIASKESMLDSEVAEAKYEIAVPATTYKIAVTQAAGGTVSADKETAAEGATVSVTATPADGYELEAVTVDGEAIDGTSFKMPASDVTVSAKFAKKPKTKPEVKPEVKPDKPVIKPDKPETTGALSLTGTGHVQRDGDAAARAEGTGILIGTTGESKRLESFSVALPEGTDGSIEYRSHMQRIGWESSWAKDGAKSGTTGESRRVEAIQAKLAGKVADTHSVWYRVHSQTWGWLGWAKDGQAAGTAGQSKRAEAVELQVLPKGQRPADYEEGKASYVGAATADVHMRGSGWTGSGSALKFGTTGQSRRLEAIRLSVPNQPAAGGISYEVHAQRIGWMSAVSDGELAGTEGQSRRLEAVRLSLTGDMARGFSVWYRVHSQSYGWLGWAKDGQDAGTTGLSKRAEAMEVQVLPQGQVPRGYDASQAACATEQ